LGRGIVSFISNYSYVSEQSYVVMREKLLQSFDKIWIENMHGNRNKTEYAPDGRTSETIFAMRGFSPGIRQGIVISLAVKTGKKNPTNIVRFRDDINLAKADERRAQLLETLNDPQFDSRYEIATPEPFNRYSLQPREVAADYRTWPTLENFAKVAPINGLMEKRGGALIDMSSEKLRERMESYFDNDLSWDAFKLLGNPLAEDAGRYAAEKTRKRLIHDEGFQADNLVQYFVRPFDFRYCYYSGVRPLWNEPRPQLRSVGKIPSNAFLVSRPTSMADPEGVPFFFTKMLGDNDAIRGHAYYFPMRAQLDEGSLLGKIEITNLGKEMRSYLQKLGFEGIDHDPEIYSSPWWHALAIGFSPNYLEEHSEGLAIGWPRIPMPIKRADFDRSAGLGKLLADILNPDVNVTSIISAGNGDHLKIMGSVSATDLAITAGWGGKTRRVA
jgi:predicted helicase